MTYRQKYAQSRACAHGCRPETVHEAGCPDHFTEVVPIYVPFGCPFIFEQGPLSCAECWDRDAGEGGNAMPGRITRTGIITELPQISAEDQSRMLDAIVAAFLDLRPESIREAVEKYRQEVQA